MAQKLLDTRFLLLGSIGFRATLYKYNIYSRPHVSYHLALVRVATPTRSKAMARPRFQATSVVMYDLSTGSGADTFRIFLFVNAYLWLIYGSFATCYCTRVQFLCAFGRRFGVCKPKMWNDVLRRHSHWIWSHLTCEKRLLATSCPSVCPSAWNKSAPTGRISIKYDIWVFFLNLSRKIQVSLTYNKNSGYFTWRPIYIFDYSVSSSWKEKCFRNRL
jgi:hypothetical protein